METATIGALVAVVVSMMELIKYLVRRSQPERSVLTRKEAMQLGRLAELHEKTDANGTPAWYFKASVIEEISEAHKQHTTILQEILLELKRQNGKG